MRSTPFKADKKELIQLIEASPVAMVAYSGAEEQVELVNRKFIELFGYTIQDIAAVGSWWTLAYPNKEYREKIHSKWNEEVEQAIREKGETKPIEACVTCKDGSKRYVEFCLSSIGERHLVTFIDLTEKKLAEEALNERERHSQSLLRLSRKLEQAKTYSDTLNAAHDEVREIIGYQNLWVYLLSEDGKSFKALVAGGEISDTVMSEAGTATLPIQGDKMLEEIAEAREIVVVEDARTDPRTNKDIVNALGNRTLVNIPIILLNRHMGTVGMGTFGDEGVRIPTVSEKEYLIAMASHMAVALDRIHLLKKREQIEQDLFAQGREHQALLENIPDLIVRYDTNLRRIYVNPAWERASGLSAQEVINVSPAKIPKVPSLINEEYMEKLQQVLKTGTPQSAEFTWVNANGRTLFLEYVIVPEFDQHGKLSGILSVGRDITERKQMEEALAAREREFRTLAENSPDNIARYDINCRTIYVNPTLEKTLGHSAPDMLGTFPGTAGFITEAEEYQDKMREVLQTGEEAELDVVLPDTGEGMHYHNIRFVAERDAGRAITGILAIGRDITERKQMEEAISKSESELRALINCMTDIIFVGNSEGRFLKIVDTNASLFYKPPQELLGKTLREVFPKDQADFFLKQLRQSLDTKKSVDFEYNLLIGDQVMWFFATVSPMTEDQTLMVARNITVQKKAEEALQKNNALLERIFSSTEFLIAYMDTDFNFIRVNRAYAEGDQQTPEYFVGKNHFTLYPNEENEKIFRDVLATGETYVVYAKPFVYASHPERGTTYWNWTLQPVKEADGSITGLVLSMVDVTARERAVIARRESDERYRTLVEQASDGIFVADSNGNYIDVNPSGCAMLGFTREEILQLNMRDLASLESQAKKPLKFDQLRAGKNITTERTLNTKSGAALPVEISGKMLDNGNIIGIVRNITERKRHELEREAIITVSASLRQVSTRTEIISIIFDKLLELFEADGTVMVLPDPLTGGYIDEMGRGVVGERMIGLNVPPGKGVCNWVIENKKPYLNNQAQNDPLFYRPDLLGDSNCLATVPLITNEQVIGALWIARKKEISDADLRLLNAIADIAANAIHRVMLHEQTRRQLQHLIALHQIDLAITTNFNLNATLDIILTNVKIELDVDAAAILLLNPVTHTLDHTASMGFKTRTIERSRVKLADGCTGLAAREQRIVSHPDLKLVHGSFSRSSLLMDENFTAYFVAPLISKGQVKGVLEVFKHNLHEPDEEWLSYFETLATQAAIAIESVNMFNNLQRSNSELTLAYDATIEGWSLALDLRDKETEGHSQRVTEMTLQLAEKIGMTDVEKLNLKRGALLHDIGKMGIPDSILLKPGTLTLDEIKTMRQHPIYAYQMLSPITYLKHAVEIPYCHHEKWDGSGYPRGLKGEEIPLSARLFTVVDVFDALSSDRPYRKAWPRKEIFRYIEEKSGKHFDPKIAKIFLEMMKDRS
ncbi:MAG: PAS domain S-box protein [Anaerolineales bacterium]|nr:PAS domain S-box protein [Anaerolineales bacterium]